MGGPNCFDRLYKCDSERQSEESFLMMNYSAASCKVSIDGYENAPNIVTPECFYRGSSPNPPLVSRVEPPLKACGNECAREGATLAW
jgi:hypothetical protein